MDGSYFTPLLSWIIFLHFMMVSILFYYVYVKLKPQIWTMAKTFIYSATWTLQNTHILTRVILFRTLAKPNTQYALWVNVNNQLPR